MEFNRFTKWMDEYQGYNSLTQKMYLRLITQYYRWLREYLKISNDSTDPQLISAGSIRDYRKYLAIIEQKKPSTINKSIQVLRIYCKWAQYEGLISTNAAARVNYIEEPMLAPKSLSETEVDLLRIHLERKPLKTQALISMGLGAGLRVSEVANLQLKDLKLRKRGGEVYVRAGKGFKFRTVPIAPDLVALLQSYLSNRKDLNGYVFISDRFQTKMSTRAIQKVVEKLRDELGFYFSFHTLRHTYCTDLLNSGMELTDVAILAGHTKKNGMPNIATTARYVMSRPDKLAKAVRKMARLRNKRLVDYYESDACGKDALKK